MKKEDVETLRNIVEFLEAMVKGDHSDLHGRVYPAFEDQLYSARFKLRNLAGDS